MTDYIDFIDAPAVRNHLRTLPPLPPAQQCILAAVSLVMRGKDSLVGFLECLTNDDVKFLEEDAIRIVEQEKSGTRPSYRSAILRADHPGLPANLFLWSPTFRGFPGDRPRAAGRRGRAAL